MMKSDNSVLNGPAFVIVPLPVINDYLGVNDVAEPVLIQTFITKTSVKAINMRVT
jgi:hypothetical protein